jgi:hypothetical protein
VIVTHCMYEYNCIFCLFLYEVHSSLERFAEATHDNVASEKP